MNRPIYKPPALNGGSVQPLAIFSAEHLEVLTSGAGLTFTPNVDLDAAASALDCAFGEFAYGEQHRQRASSPAESRDWLVEVARLCRALFVAVSEGKEGLDGIDARSALRALEPGSVDYQQFAELVRDASPSRNNGQSQSWCLKEFDESGINNRYRFLLEMALPALLQAVALVADAEHARLSPTIRRGRPAVPDLTRRFLFVELGRVYATIHDLNARRPLGSPGKAGWHRAVIAFAAEQAKGVEAQSVQALAAWAKGDRQGIPLPTRGDEVKKAIGAADLINNTRD